MRRFHTTVVLAIGFTGVMVSLSAFAQPITPQAAVERLFREPADAGWFAPLFLENVTVEQVSAIVNAMTGEFGALQRVTGSGGRFTAKLEKADVPITIALDDSGRITSLFAQPAIPTGGSLDDYAAAIATLPGKTSLLVVTDGAERTAKDADAPLAVGSAAKLAILQALDEAVKAGRLAWDQVVALDPKWRTLPASDILDWPADTPITIATLTNLMISISDNMATDALISLVGRAPIEAITPRNTPFLTTAEIFKLQTNPEMLKAWAAGDVAAKRAVLDKVGALPLPGVDQLTTARTEAEWFMSVRELCALLDRVAALPAFQINPGLAERGMWKAVAYKGGSGIGVLNFSTRLVAEDGTTHCVVATWNNDSALTAEQLATPYRGILATLAAGGGGSAAK
jgi:hypothetical protein